MDYLPFARTTSHHERRSPSQLRRCWLVIGVDRRFLLLAKKKDLLFSFVLVDNNDNGENDAAKHRDVANSKQTSSRPAGRLTSRQPLKPERRAQTRDAQLATLRFAQLQLYRTNCTIAHARTRPRRRPRRAHYVNAERVRGVFARARRRTREPTSGSPPQIRDVQAAVCSRFFCAVVVQRVCIRSTMDVWPNARYKNARRR